MLKVEQIVQVGCQDGIRAILEKEEQASVLPGLAHWDEHTAVLGLENTDQVKRAPR